MKQNIFEGAEFGDKFITRDGRLALYLSKDKQAYILFVQETSYLSAYDYDGSMVFPKHKNNPADIVSKYTKTNR